MVLLTVAPRNSTVRTAVHAKKHLSLEMFQHSGRPSKHNTRPSATINICTVECIATACWMAFFFFLRHIPVFCAVHISLCGFFSSRQVTATDTSIQPSVSHAAMDGW